MTSANDENNSKAEEEISQWKQQTEEKLSTVDKAIKPLPNKVGVYSKKVFQSRTAILHFAQQDVTVDIHVLLNNIYCASQKHGKTKCTIIIIIIILIETTGINHICRGNVTISD